MRSEKGTPIVVLDTNVIVSALLKADSPPARLLAAVARGNLTKAFDARILTEYRDVLLRPKFGFDPSRIEFVLEAIERDGIAVVALTWALSLPNPDDCKFLEVASAVEPPAVVVSGTPDTSRLSPAEACALRRPANT